MKFFLMLVLSAISAATLFAASIPRTDLDATKAKIKLVPGKSDDAVRIANQSWGPEETRPFRLIAVARKPVAAEWVPCKFAFTPESAGTVTVSICGESAKDPAQRGWVAVTGLKINGVAVDNADLTKVEKKGGKDIPAGYWFSGKAAYAANGGPNGAGAAIVNHDNRLFRNIKVEAGKPVTVEYMVKAAEAQK